MEKKGSLDEEKKKQMERKNRARQSPYPTIIIEIKTEPRDEESIEDEHFVDKVDISGGLSDVVKQLEAIFAKSAALHKGSPEDIFYNSIGYVSQMKKDDASPKLHLPPISCIQ